MWKAVKSNEKLTRKNLVELNKALNRIGKLQGTDQKISELQCLVEEKFSCEKRERPMAEKGG